MIPSRLVQGLEGLASVVFKRCSAETYGNFAQLGGW